MKKNIPSLLIFILLFSCGTSKKKPCPQTMESTSVEKLGEIIDLSKYKPTKVKFKYVYCDNSGTENRSIPGPSDHYLNALMYFDEATFKNLQMFKQVDTHIWPIPDFKKEDFDFDWLDEEIKTELMKSDTAYHGDHDRYFNSNGKLWMMENKLLLLKRSS